jgi:hypothetical protein
MIDTPIPTVLESSVPAPQLDPVSTATVQHAPRLDALHLPPIPILQQAETLVRAAVRLLFAEGLAARRGEKMIDTGRGRVLHPAERSLLDETNIAAATTVPGLLLLGGMDMIHTHRAARDLRHRESVRHHLLGAVVPGHRLHARPDMRNHARVLIAPPSAGSPLVLEILATAETSAVVHPPLLDVIGRNRLWQIPGGVDHPPQSGRHIPPMMPPVGSRLQLRAAPLHHRCILLGPPSWLTIALLW